MEDNEILSDAAFNTPTKVVEDSIKEKLDVCDAIRFNKIDEKKEYGQHSFAPFEFVTFIKNLGINDRPTHHLEDLKFKELHGLVNYFCSGLTWHLPKDEVQEQYIQSIRTSLKRIEADCKTKVDKDAFMKLLHSITGHCFEEAQVEEATKRYETPNALIKNDSKTLEEDENSKLYRYVSKVYYEINMVDEAAGI